MILLLHRNFIELIRLHPHVIDSFILMAFLLICRSLYQFLRHEYALIC